MTESKLKTVAGRYRWTIWFLAVATTLGVALVLVTNHVVVDIARTRVVDALKTPTESLATHAVTIWDSNDDPELAARHLSEFASDVDIASIVIHDERLPQPLVFGRYSGGHPGVAEEEALTSGGVEELSGVAYFSSEESNLVDTDIATLRAAVVFSRGRVEVFRDISLYVGEQVGQFHRTALIAVSAIVAIYTLGLVSVFIAIDRRFARGREELVAQNVELAKANAAKDHILTTTSHELKTPLTSIISFSDLLSHRLSDRLSKTESKFLDIVRRNSERLKNLIDDLVDLAAVESGRIRTMPEEFEVVGFIRDAVSDLSSENTLKGRHVRFGTEVRELFVHADPLRVTQVISNLLINSGKYSDPGTPISLSITYSDEQVKISVKDRGFGIPRDQIDQVFDPFFRSTQDKVKEEQGLGIGLALSRRIVELHGGDIGARNREQGGSEFWFTLPVIKENSASGMQASA